MTRFEPNLRIPGPTALPPSVREAGGRQMVNHRGDEFKALTKRVEASMKPFFGTEHDVILLTCAGTGGLEAAVVNVLSPGDPVLAVTMGAFGDRFAKVAEVYGAAVTQLEVEWGQAPEAGGGARGRGGDPGPQGRAPHPQRDLHRRDERHRGAGRGRPRGRARRAGAGGRRSPRWARCPFAMDAWGCDLVVTGSQKAWMSAPGMAFAAVGPRAWAAAETATMPRFYLDLRRHRDSQVNGESPWTPAVAVMYQVDEGIRLMQAEGEGVYARHAACAAMTRAGLRALGFELLADDAVASQDGHRRLDPGGPRLEGVQRRAQAPRPRARRRPGQAQGPDLPARATWARSPPTTSSRPISALEAQAHRGGHCPSRPAPASPPPRPALVARGGPADADPGRRAPRRRGPRAPAPPPRRRRAARPARARRSSRSCPSTTRSSSAARSRSTPR